MNLLMLLLFASSPHQELKTLTYAAGYIPNIQFAPFYVAMERGYYREAGIQLQMDYTIGSDVLKLVAVGKAQIGSVDPDAFLHAVIRGMPLTHIATLYQRYPIALISDQPIDSQSLKGKRVGIGGAYGASYLGLKRILAEMGLDLTDIDLDPIGFTQVSALQQGRVDAVMGYINNEPIQLEKLGTQVFTKTPSTGNDIPGVGLMTSKVFREENGPLVEAFLTATFRGMHDVLTDPEGSYRLVVEKHLPELAAGDRYGTGLRVLKTTLPYWQTTHTEKAGFGQSEKKAWQRLADQLKSDQNNERYQDWQTWVNLKFHWKPQS